MSPSATMNEPTRTPPPRALQPTAVPIIATKASILCGTDFSQNARQAVEAGAALAKRLDEPLVLVHALDDEARTTLPTEVRESLCLYERAQLHEELELLREAKVKVIEAFSAGKPDVVLVKSGMVHNARLLVLSSQGRRPLGGWVLGTVAERTAEASLVPTLIVRTAAPFTRWALGGRSLRVFVGADFSAPSEAALRWVQWLRQVGPCDVSIAYLEPTLPAVNAFNMSPAPAVVELLVKAERVQARCFRQRVRALLGSTRVRIRVEKGWGRSDAHLIQMAREERADLIVVGTHQRHGLDRLGHLSVSRGVLHYAPMSVACVPAGAALDPDTQ